MPNPDEVGDTTPPKVDASLWLSLQGRVSRKTFWLYFIVPIYVVALIAAVLDGVTGAAPTHVIAEAVRSTFGETYLSMSAFAGPISNFAILVYLWPTTAGVVKRLHDLGLSGWLWPVYAALACACWGVFLMSPDSALGVALAVLAGLLGLVFSVYVYLMPGTSGPNEYGPDPVSR